MKRIFSRLSRNGLLMSRHGSHLRKVVAAESPSQQIAMAKALEQLKTISKEDYAKVKALAAIVKPLRSVLHKTPDDYGMTGWRDIYFPSDDGTPLEG